MGGFSGYDRPTYSSSSTDNWGASGASASKLSSTVLDKSMLPNDKVLMSRTKTPVIIVLDVTGSNINFARLLYDKFPMFFGNITEKGYLSDFDIAVLACGDAYSDQYPLQVPDFAKGKEIDGWLEKLVLEGHGGGSRQETYELVAQYLVEKTEFTKGATPIVFFIGDEAPYPKVDKGQAKKFGIPCQESVDPFPALRDKFKDNVFMFLNKYSGREWNSDITNAWTSRLELQHVIKVQEEKAIVDLMLGVLALFGKRSLKTYALDMAERDQTKARIESVTSSLEGVSTALVPVSEHSVGLTKDGAVKKSKQGKRL